MENTKETKLKLLSKYGLGCAAVKLDKEGFAKYSSFSIGSGPMDEGLLKTALPYAYKEIVEKGKDCREYFFTSHNNKVLKTLIKKEFPGYSPFFCLARTGTVETVMDAETGDRIALSKLLGDNMSDAITKIGNVSFTSEDGATAKEMVLLDAVPDARIGSIISVHRQIACEIIKL